MLLRLRHIGMMLLVVLLVMSCTSCTRWREAKEVVAEAERLLAKGEIMQDTAVLTEVINTLDNPIGHVIAKDELAEAYYLMGRNMDDYCHDFAAAADYYIEADRLQTTDLVLRGRINSCMGFICKQDSCFVEALEFYERACDAHQKSDNIWYYTHNLLNVAEQYVNLGKYNKADSVLLLASNYDVDSAYYADIVDIKALALYNQQLYDSALVCLLSIKDVYRPLEARCCSYWLISRCYNRTKKIVEAVPYADYIVTNSCNAVYRSNAYYILTLFARTNNNVDLLVKFSNNREDEDRRQRHFSESYAQASDKLNRYLENPYPHRGLYTIIVCSVLVLILFSWIIYVLIKRHRCVLVKRDKENQDRRDLFARRIYDHSVYFTSWQDYKKLRELANSHFNNMCYQLEDTYHLSEQEIKICLMLLLEYTNKQMAEILLVQPNTISKAKNKIAKQLNTSSAELRTSLLDILA